MKTGVEGRLKLRMTQSGMKTVLRFPLSRLCKNERAGLRHKTGNGIKRVDMNGVEIIIESKSEERDDALHTR